MKTNERAQARTMRLNEGRSIKEIARLLHVAPSSVSLWVRDIELTPDQHEALRQRNPAYNRQLSGRLVWAARCRALRGQWQAEGRELARRGDSRHAAGCMLYWAEGRKHRNQLQLSNSDPELVRFFAAFLRQYFSVPDERFRVACHLFADHVERQREIEHFWLTTLGLSESSLCTSIVNLYSRHSQRKRLNMLPYGTCKLTINDTSIAQTIYGAIQEYGGFDRPEWLG